MKRLRPSFNMLQPAHLDGRTLVIFRRQESLLHSPFRKVASGRLEHDGSILTFVGDGGERVISDEELASLMPVSDETRIPECRGFDFFRIE